MKRNKNKMMAFAVIAILICGAFAALSTYERNVNLSDSYAIDNLLGSADYDINFSIPFGGSNTDTFRAVAATTDGGFVAAGHSWSSSFGNGDWTGFTSRGGLSDAIIVKFDADGNIVWKNNFGGSDEDRFNAVAETSDGGFVAVGYSFSSSFGNGDWVGVTGRGNNDAIIVKFDIDGNVVWKKNFGGSAPDYFYAVTATSDGGSVAAGNSHTNSIGNGDWAGVTGRGDDDAIIVKFDADGNVVWKTPFGGSANDYFYAVTATTDGGFVAAGHSWSSSFGTGDWIGVTGRGSTDAIIVKFDSDGNIVWKNYFGGSSVNSFYAVTATTDGGFVAIGVSFSGSFGNGDWTGVTGRGDNDAIIVKFDSDGNIVWKKNFGGIDNDQFLAVTATTDGGSVAAGYSSAASFGTGDWTGVTGRGYVDAIIVKFDIDGNVVWKKNFGGSSADWFYAVAATTDGSVVAVGDSAAASFGTGDWTGVTGRGGTDAIIVKFSETRNNNIDPIDDPTDVAIIMIKSIISLLAVIGVGLLVSRISSLISIGAATLVGLIIAMVWWL